MTPVRLKPAPLGLESSTQPLSHCAPRFGEKDKVGERKREKDIERVEDEERDRGVR